MAILNKGERSLKQRNRPQLIVFLSLNVVVLGVWIVGIQAFSALLNQIMKGDLALLTRVVALPAIVGLLLGIVSWTIPKHWKEAMVCWRSGTRRLPSSEAFTRIAPADLRINMTELSARLGVLPTQHQEQSALWYSIYRKHRDDVSVEDANSAYLLYREMTALVPLLLLLLLLLAAVIHFPSETLALAAVALAVEYLVLMLAARNAGSRLVSNVLAVECATPHKAEPKAAKKPRTPKDTTTARSSAAPESTKNASND